MYLFHCSPYAVLQLVRLQFSLSHILFLTTLFDTGPQEMSSRMSVHSLVRILRGGRPARSGRYPTLVGCLKLISFEMTTINDNDNGGLSLGGGE